jgi:hypothetical protein
MDKKSSEKKYEDGLKLRPPEELDRILAYVQSYDVTIEEAETALYGGRSMKNIHDDSEKE